MTTETSLRAYHGDPDVKKATEERVRARQTFSENYLASGLMEKQHECLVRRSKFPYRLGMPQWVAELIDTIFYSLSCDDKKWFPMAFVEAVPVGFEDWENAGHDFLAWLLADNVHGLVALLADHPNEKAAILTVSELHRRRRQDRLLWRRAAEQCKALREPYNAETCRALDSAREACKLEFKHSVRKAGFEAVHAWTDHTEEMVLKNQGWGVASMTREKWAVVNAEKEIVRDKAERSQADMLLKIFSEPR